jgi:hypothetical protein
MAAFIGLFHEHQPVGWVQVPCYLQGTTNSGAPYYDVTHGAARYFGAFSFCIRSSARTYDSSSKRLRKPGNWGNSAGSCLCVTL